MPVFNTGLYLTEAIDSVLNQKPSLSGRNLPSFELLVVDDHSTDTKTLAILNDFSNFDSRVKILQNQRTKGAAGARNTGISVSRGEWIGFLDSDDILCLDSLALRWEIISKNKEIRWLAAHFQLLKSNKLINNVPVFEVVKNLVAHLDRPGGAPDMVRLLRPVAKFADSCMIGIMTVLIQRDLIIEKGMFNEQLPRAEDYHLWFKCAFDNDLYLINSVVAFYRIHPGSLTHGNHPKHLYEDTMVRLLLREPAGREHVKLLMRRFDISMQEQCYFYRRHKSFGAAFKKAFQWTYKRPMRLSPWKEVIACMLRVG